MQGQYLLPPLYTTKRNTIVMSAQEEWARRRLEEEDAEKRAIHHRRRLEAKAAAEYNAMSVWQKLQHNSSVSAFILFAMFICLISFFSMFLT